jgi:lysyl-tRNA synthetase class 1
MRAAASRIQTAYWADEIAAEAIANGGAHVVNDSKTPSGTIHVGSLRGVVLHDAIRRAVSDAGAEVELRYGVEDLDPMDAQALLTPDAVEKYMGVPLAHVPPPEGSPHPSYARHFASLFLDTFERLGIRPRLYWMSEQYGSGAMDAYIERALDRAALILEIYRTVSTVSHPSDWLPISVICQNCGRSGTTRAFDWSGSEVSYECRPDLVEWAIGCGHRGRVSPFGGRAKLVWNVDWAARWGLVGATIEGCGKDLATAGGSRDRADAISRRVFDREPPRNIPYEFLNVGGRKMSTSRGEGAAAHRIAELLPPDILRFLFLRYQPNHAINFDPQGDTIPRLFDEFDRCAAAVAGRPVKGELPANVERIFALSLPDDSNDVAAAAAEYRPPFAHLAMLLQVPGPPLAERFAAEKGAPLDEEELAILHEREAAAAEWLASFAPASARLAIQHDELPASAAELEPAERSFLARLADDAEAAPPSGGEGWQALIFDAARESDLPAGRAFGVLYRVFLDRPNGPRAGWLLSSLSPAFVIGRLREAASTTTAQQAAR